MTNDELIAHLFTQEAAHLKLVREQEESTSHEGWWISRKDALIVYLAAAEQSLHNRVERWLTDDQGAHIGKRTIALLKTGYFTMVPTRGEAT